MDTHSNMSKEEEMVERIWEKVMNLLNLPHYEHGRTYKTNVSMLEGFSNPS